MSIFSRIPDEYFSGTFTASSSPTTISDAPAAIEEICFQVDPQALVDVYVGGASAQHIRLMPGQSLDITTNNARGLWFSTLSGSAVVRWLVRT